jgi:hypothetical protein
MNHTRPVCCRIDCRLGRKIRRIGSSKPFYAKNVPEKIRKAGGERAWNCKFTDFFWDTSLPKNPFFHQKIFA